MKPIYGVGTNDSLTPVTWIDPETGRRTTCPLYTTWRDMLRRCYSAEFQDEYPTYRGCCVATEWHLFSTFRTWMESQPWSGLQIDKDVMFPGNKVYGPTTCVFITQTLNKLLLDRAAARGQYPIGVNWHKASGKFVAQCNIKGKRTHLGLFTDANEAHQIYRATKKLEIIEAALEQTDHRIIAGLLNHSDLV